MNMHPYADLKPFGLALAMVLTFAGCATERSNYQKSDEQFTVLAVPLDKASLAAEALDPASLGFEAAVRLGKYFIDKEAEHYESSSECVSRLAVPFPGPQGTLLIVTRSFLELVDTNLPLVATQGAVLADQIKDRLAAVGLVPDRGLKLTSRNVAESWVKQQGGANRLSFCALVLAAPVTNNTMELTLLGYSYPGLKAKNSWIHIPFTSWHKVKSVLSLSIEGAAGYSALAYKAEHAYSSRLITWPRNGALAMANAWLPAELISGEIVGAGRTTARNKYSSKLLALPPHPVQISVSLVESSDMKKTLNKLGEKIGGLKLEDFKD